MTDSPNRLFGLTASAKEQLVKRMVERRVKRPGASAAAAAPAEQTGADINEAFVRFDQLPGYQELHIQKAAADRLEIDNPYFKLHQGIASNTTLIGNREYVNYASYNYLDLCGHPAVSAAAKAAIDRFGTSASASRPVSGERPVQRDLEAALAAMHQVEDCVVFVSGHATNVSTLGHLFGPKDLIVHDQLIHNSATQGAKLSGARRLPFAHNDWQAAEAILARERHKYERAVVVVEGIYSMDGDLPDLPRFIHLKRQYKTFLMVDEAHSIGVLGDRGHGLREHFDVPGTDVDIWMGTLSKTLSSCGGYIAGERALVEYLKFSAPGFLYSVGMAPPIAASALAALQQMDAEPERVRHLRDRGLLFKRLAEEAGLDTGLSEGYAVIPVIVGSSIKTARLSNALFDRGINVQPIIYPAVEERAARLRFFLCTAHTDDQIRETIDAVREELDGLSKKSPLKRVV